MMWTVLVIAGVWLAAIGGFLLGVAYKTWRVEMNSLDVYMALCADSVIDLLGKTKHRLPFCQYDKFMQDFPAAYRN